MKPVKLFSPLLLFYVAVVLSFTSDGFVWDEKRYVGYATNLSKGYYTPRDNIALINGPGYPIVLLPFIISKSSLILPKMLNAFLLFGAIIWFYKTVCLYTQEKIAVICSYLLSVYPPILKFIPHLMPDALALFLLCAFLYHFCRFHQLNNFGLSYLIVASFILSYLALTRTIFGYVILFGLAGSIIFKFFMRIKDNKTIFTYILALVFCLPYLLYTYSLTGKVFYWATNGGEVLYWMSTPYEKELGEWMDRKNVYKRPELSNHIDHYNKLKSLSRFQEDTVFKTKAFENIRNHPVKYVKNWLANIGRLFFSYPYSYTYQKLSTYFYIFPNMFLIFGSLFCVYPSVIGRKLIPFEIKSLIVFGLIYIGGSTLVSASARYFTFIVPVFLLFISFTLNNFVKIRISDSPQT